jgi:hypothetical protein
MGPDADLPDALYVYRPVRDNSNNVRLLHDSRDQKDVIWCDITTASLATMLVYVCLLYS